MLRTRKRNSIFNHYYLYASVFPLPAIAFFCLLMGLKSCLVFSLSITIYYSSMENQTSNKLLFAPFISILILEWLKTLFLLVIFFSILKWPATSFLPVTRSQGLIAFLLWQWLIIFSLSELLIKSLSLLLNMLNNSMTFSCNSLPCLNVCFNTRFCSMRKICSFLST